MSNQLKKATGSIAIATMLVIGSVGAANAAWCKVGDGKRVIGLDKDQVIAFIESGLEMGVEVTCGQRTSEMSSRKRVRPTFSGVWTGATPKNY